MKLAPTNQNMRKYIQTLFSAVLFLPALLIAQEKDSIFSKSLEEVIVTGQYRPQSLKNSVYQVRVIGNQLIRASAATNMQQVLSTQLGLRFSQDNTLGTSDVQLMGMSGRNVKILLDGIPLVDRGETRESLDQVDINSVERIEIVEGPMSVSYGSDALAGVINIITKKQDRDRFSVTARMQEETNGNEYHPFSYRGKHMQHLGITGAEKGWNYAASGTHLLFNGFGGDDYGRNKDWKPKEQWLGNVKLGYALKRFNIYYRLDGMHEMIKDRGPMNENTYKAIDKRYFSNRYLHQLQSSWSFNNDLQWNSILAYTDYQRKTKTTRHDFEKNTDELTNGAGEQDLSSFTSFLSRNTVQYKISSLISMQPGFEIQREAASGARISGSPVIWDLALFLSAEISPTNKIKLRPGLRFPRNSVYEAPPVIPSFNAKFLLSEKASVRLSYAYGFRSPSLRELYFDFRDANHQIVGNKELKAEHSNSFAGYFDYDFLPGKEMKLKTTVSGFYNAFNDLINYAQSATDPDLYMTMNIDKFRTIGGTIDNKFEKNVFSATLGFSYIGRYNVYADQKDYTDENLPAFTWSPEINSVIIYRVPAVSGSISLVCKFTGDRPAYQVFYNAATAEDEVVQVTAPAYHWADLNFQKSLFGKIDLSAGVRNIFNVKDIQSRSIVNGIHNGASSIPIGYGRSYFLGLSYQWNKK